MILRLGRISTSFIVCLGLSTFLMGCPNQIVPLTVAVNGPGTVQFSPPGGSYLFGTVVTVTAVPEVGARFERWEGDLSGAVPSLSIPMLAPVSATAVFSNQSVTLTMATTGQGAVTSNPAGTSFPVGTTLTLTATPASGWQFDHWEGDLSGNTNPIALLMNSNRYATAVFSPISPAAILTTSVQGSGQVNQSPMPPYQTGEPVILTAVPAPGFRFDHWEGDLTGNVNPAQLTLSGITNVTAVFLPALFTFTPQVVGQGVLQVSPGGSTFVAGTPLTLSAVPDSGFRFDHWEGDLVGSNNPATIVMDGSKTVTAIFAPLQFQVTTHVTGQGNVSLAPAGGTYDFGSVVTLIPLPAPGWEFKQWSGDLVGNQPVQQVTISGDLTISAEFIRSQFTLTVQTVGGDGSAGLGGSITLDPPGGVYPSGTVVTLRPVPDAQHRFDAWYNGDIIGNDVPVSITMDDDHSVSAYFSFLDNLQFSPAFLTPTGERLYFLASTPWTGNELWTSDGTLAGTHLVRDLNPGPFSLDARFISALGNTAYLFAFYEGDWRILASDGNSAGTTPIAALQGEFPMSAPVRVGDVLYFNTLGNNTASIWRTDGSTAGTFKIEESSPPLSYVLHDLSGMLYFTTNDPADASVPRRLWKTEGTPGSSTLIHESSQIGDVVGLNGIPVFAADDGSNQGHLGIFAGTEPPRLISTFGSGPGLLTPAGAVVYFLATVEGIPDSGNLWATDGVGATPVVTSAYYTRDYIDLDGILIYKGFFHNGAIESYGLFRADETGGTLLHAINPTIGYGPSSYQVNVGGTLFFNAENSTGGIGLWKCDGTESGTQLVSEIAPIGSGPVELVRLRGKAYFFAEEMAHGRQLWQSDGSQAGTHPVSYPHP